MPLEDLHTNAALFILAGSETTATLLCGVTYLLLTNPECLEKVVNEVRSSYTAPEEITLTSVNKLQYMLACLNETFRRYPPSPGWLPRRVVNGSATICGNVVAEGVSFSQDRWGCCLASLGNGTTDSEHPDPCFYVAIPDVHE